MVAVYKRAGLVKNVYVTNSNLSIPTAISQFNNMITADHCSAILTIPNGTSGLDNVIKKAYDAGIPVVVDQGPQTTPYGENYDENFYALGKAYLDYFAKSLHGNVNLLDVIGIPGETLSVDYQTALKAFLKTHKNFHVVGTVTGKVTDSIAKQAVLQFLSTHPGKVDAVYQEGGMASGILQAFIQQNRPIPAMGDVGAGGFLSVWHDLLKKGQHPNFIGLAEPPGASMRGAFRAMIMLLEGRHPKNITIYFTPPQINEQNLNSWWNPSLTSGSTNYPEAPNIMPMKDLYPYFTNPAPTMPYAGKGKKGQG
jgi:ribose transport system substrate-binding protein